MRGTVGTAIWTLALLTLLAGCSTSSDQPQELMVFAAASLAEALGEVKVAFEARQPYELIITYGGSQMLAHQITGGAPADLFLAAGESPVEFLDERELVQEAGTTILTNRLVLVTRKSGGLELATMEQLAGTRVRRVAMADPELAPAGLYARESLQSLGLWDALNPRIVYGSDVRATMAYVETGNADAAIVYLSDALESDRLGIFDIVPSESYSTIRYPAAIVRGSQVKEGANELLAFLRGEEALGVFTRHGFEVMR